MLPTPVDINQRLVQDLADPERGVATVNALLHLGHGAFDRMSWHECHDPQDPETVHAASLWSWACQIAGITPAMQRLSRSIPEHLQQLGEHAPQAAWTLFQNDAWGVLNQAQRNVPLSNRAWTLSQALDHLLGVSPVPGDAIQARFPCALDDDPEDRDGIPSPPGRDDARWRTPMGRAVRHTLMAWVLSVKDEVALRLVATAEQTGLPRSAWFGRWALRTDPAARSLTHRLGSPWVAPYLMHLAQHDRWALVLALLPPAGTPSVDGPPSVWSRATLTGLPDSPTDGRRVVDDLASKALRRLTAPEPDVVFDDNVRPRAAILERLIVDSLTGDESARTLLEHTVQAPLLRALRDAPVERWASDDVQQRLRSLLDHHTQRRALEALPMPSDLAAHARTRL